MYYISYNHRYILYNKYNSGIKRRAKYRFTWYDNMDLVGFDDMVEDKKLEFYDKDFGDQKIAIEFKVRKEKIDVPLLSIKDNSSANYIKKGMNILIREAFRMAKFTKLSKFEHKYINMEKVLKLESKSDVYQRETIPANAVECVECTNYGSLSGYNVCVLYISLIYMKRFKLYMNLCLCIYCL